jgi:hypothetical protein
VTPPAAAAAPAAPAVRPRRPAAPRGPRRVSGPARRPAQARPAQRTAGARTAGADAGLILGLVGALEAVAGHRLFDRLIRGRAWIGIVAFALIGIVTLQLGLLKLNGGIGRALEHEALLQRTNSALSIENSELAAGTRVEAQAGRLGMAFAPSGSLHFLSANAHGDIAKAVAALGSAAHAAAQAREASAAAAASESSESQASESGAEAESSAASSASNEESSSESSSETSGEAEAAPSSGAGEAASGEASSPAAAGEGESSSAASAAAEPSGGISASSGGE